VRTCFGIVLRHYEDFGFLNLTVSSCGRKQRTGRGLRRDVQRTVRIAKGSKRDCESREERTSEFCNPQQEMSYARAVDYSAIWLPLVDAFRTFCLRPSIERKALFGAIQQLALLSLPSVAGVSRAIARWHRQARL